MPVDLRFKFVVFLADIHLQIPVCVNPRLPVVPIKKLHINRESRLFIKYGHDAVGEIIGIVPGNFENDLHLVPVQIPFGGLALKIHLKLIFFETKNYIPFFRKIAI